MNKLFARLGLTVTFLLFAGCGNGNIDQIPQPFSHLTITLPHPVVEGAMSVEQALLERRSIREYAAKPLTLTDISQLLWAAQGITDPRGFRTAPSAGGLYPLEIFLVAGEVTELVAGIYRYEPDGHELLLVVEGDHRYGLSRAALDQAAIRDAPAVIVIAAVYERTEAKYGERGVQYVHIEVGCVSENIYLQAASLGLGTVFIGAFHDEEVREVLQLAADEQLLGIMPVGRK